MRNKKKPHRIGAFFYYTILILFFLLSDRILYKRNVRLSLSKLDLFMTDTGFDKFSLTVFSVNGII